MTAPALAAALCDALDLATRATPHDLTVYCRDALAAAAAGS